MGGCGRSTAHLVDREVQTLDGLVPLEQLCLQKLLLVPEDQVQFFQLVELLLEVEAGLLELLFLEHLVNLLLGLLQLDLPLEEGLAICSEEVVVVQSDGTQALSCVVVLVKPTKQGKANGYLS